MAPESIIMITLEIKLPVVPTRSQININEPSYVVSYDDAKTKAYRQYIKWNYLVELKHRRFFHS